MNSFSRSGVALLATFVWGGVAMADDTLYPEDGPFRPGEGFGTPATCETMPDWIDRAPEVNGRVSMVIEGPIVESHWDGALAYLIMCTPEQVQVMCVTYYAEEVTGEPVQFAGGYNRAGERQIVLDPCLTFPVEGEPVESDGG